MELRRYDADQVDMMRSEVDDNDFLRFVFAHPGTYVLRRHIETTGPIMFRPIGEVLFQPENGDWGAL